MTRTMETVFEASRKGRKGYALPKLDVPAADCGAVLGDACRKEAPRLPEMAEVDVVRHFTGLSKMNYSVDDGFYPLGSCTMKYNPKLNEAAARMAGFALAHPLQPEDTVQGALKLLYDLGVMLGEVTGMDAFTLQPAAGAHGEQTGLMMIKAYHESRGEGHRNKIIVPDSAHGTNPASATVTGFDTVEVASDDEGMVDLDSLKSLLDDSVAGLMLTNPNTLGIFEKHVLELTDAVHKAGGLVYYDGANANAILGKTRPGDMGFDVLHLNLHKTFSTPHGGGGPGSGAVGVKAILEPFLPAPIVTCRDGRYTLVGAEERPKSIGRVRSFYGNFGVLVRAYTYLRTLGAEGLEEVAEMAVLNANYLAKKLSGLYPLAHKGCCMHEFVLNGGPLKSETGVSSMDVAKALIDAGYHPPTVYFPLIVPEALMVEPTETEAMETLDKFAASMEAIVARARSEGPEAFHAMPESTPISRPDETTAARNPVLRWQFED
ncbi:MAG: aminomethyl-transferring glycine dehydrogenase subunit GcvPB [Aminivibrio sp.]|jgi:glycine dehydrogenase subunit 2